MQQHCLASMLLQDSAAASSVWGNFPHASFFFVFFSVSRSWWVTPGIYLWANPEVLCALNRLVNLKDWVSGTRVSRRSPLEESCLEILLQSFGWTLFVIAPLRTISDVLSHQTTSCFLVWLSQVSVNIPMTVTEFGVYLVHFLSFHHSNIVLFLLFKLKTWSQFVSFWKTFVKWRFSFSLW